MLNIFSFVYAMHHFMFMCFLYVMHDKIKMFLYFHVSSFFAGGKKCIVFSKKRQYMGCCTWAWGLGLRGEI
jgi:hypothetical protein